MITIYAIFERIIYRNYFSGEALFTVRCSQKQMPRDNMGAVICFGKIQECMYGLPIKLTGDIHEYKNRKEFYVEEYDFFTPSQNLVVDFLKRNFNNVGEKTAEKIIEISNNDIFSFVNKPDAARILADNIKRFSINDAMKYVNGMRNITEFKELFNFISGVGGDFYYANLLQLKFPEITLEEFKIKPFFYGETANVPFYICDNVAYKVGLCGSDDSRLRMMIRQCLKSDVNNGNTYITLRILYSKIRYLCKNSQYDYTPSKARIMLELFKNKNIIIEKDNNNEAEIYIKKVWLQEKNSVDEYYRINNTAIKMPFKEEYINEAEKMCGISYSDEQKEAFHLLKSTGIKIVHGMPGAGKTTFTNGLLYIYKMMNPDKKIIKLCAPTGRAARRLAESTNMLASTIHSTLDIQPYEGRDDILDSIQENPADFFLIDEVSMVDIMLLECLLRAARNGALVVFVGDENQLSSVGPGNVLRDMLNSGMVETYKLEKIFRQAENSTILKNSRKINSGDAALICDDEFQIIKVDDRDEILPIIKEKYIQYYDKNEPFGIQELSPVKKEDSGVENINRELQGIINPDNNFIWFGKNKFSINDKVMTLQNDTKKGFCNGDVGVVTSIDENKMTVFMNDDFIEIGLGDMDKITLAYANTIHKSQGSEYPVVIISLPAEPEGMLQRNLLYTAVTRAKQKVILIYEGDSLEKCISNIDNTKRRTSLARRLKRHKVNQIKM